MVKNAIAVLLILYAIFGNSLFISDNIVPKPQPEPVPVSIINVDKPNESVLVKVQKFSDLITDPTDRAKLAIFNYEFANRVTKYNTDLQKLNDVYVLAAKTFFKDSLKNKYQLLPEMIVSLIQDTTTDENHILTPNELQSINENFAGVAWVLIQKR